MPNPAEKLEGITLNGEWLVGPRTPRNPNGTGGNFSQSYTAQNVAGRKVFIKALDFSKALGPGINQTLALQQLTEEFNFEKSIAELCSSKSMDRVIRAIGSGTADVDSSLLGQVPYLIFESADRDVRAHLDKDKNAELIAWKLRALHHIATGLKQLHSADIAHQDVKPSNVLVFEKQDQGQISKLGDLGRASRQTGTSPFDSLDWAGDPKYAPPEVAYKYSDRNWYKRRIAYDIYMLGSLVSFLFSRTTATAVLFHRLPLQFWPAEWGGTFEEVVPYLENAFTDVLQSFSEQLPAKLANELSEIYGYLCQPDPRKRGYPGQALNKIALERFITRFDVMARKASLGRYGT